MIYDDSVARIPVRPLSYENKELAFCKEIIINYADGSVYVKKADGTIINACVSEDTMREIGEYLKVNSEIIVNANVTNDKGETVSIQEAFTEIYNGLGGKTNLELDSSLKVQGKAADAKAVGDALTNAKNDANNNYAPKNHDHDSDYAPKTHSHSEYASSTHDHDSDYAPKIHSHNGYASSTHDHDDDYAPKDHNHDSTYFKKSGGTVSGNTTINGKLTLGNVLVLSSGSYGYGDPPTSAVEGQLYFKLIQEE